MKCSTGRRSRWRRSPERFPAPPEGLRDREIAVLVPIVFRPRTLVATHSKIATPQGVSPTGISLRRTLFAVSMTDTLFDLPFATYSFPPSRVRAMFHGPLADAGPWR